VKTNGCKHDRRDTERTKMREEITFVSTCLDCGSRRVRVIRPVGARNDDTGWLYPELRVP
jgi:hypothetical protein